MHAGEGADDKPGNMRKMPEAHLFYERTRHSSHWRTQHSADRQRASVSSCQLPTAANRGLDAC